MRLTQRDKHNTQKIPYLCDFSNVQHKICCVFVVYDSKNIEKVVEFLAQSPFVFYIIKNITFM